MVESYEKDHCGPFCFSDYKFDSVSYLYWTLMEACRRTVASCRTYFFLKKLTRSNRVRRKTKLVLYGTFIRRNIRHFNLCESDRDQLKKLQQTDKSKQKICVRIIDLFEERKRNNQIKRDIWTVWWLAIFNIHKITKNEIVCPYSASEWRWTNEKGLGNYIWW